MPGTLPSDGFKAEEAWVEGPDGTPFFTKTWSPSEPVQPVAYLLLHHGFMDHCDRYAHMASRLARDAHLCVFGFDQRGFGATAQRTQSYGVTSLPQALDDLHFFLSRLQAQAAEHRAPLFLFGQSNGGQQVIIYSCLSRKDRVTLDGLVVASPLIDQAPDTKAPRLQLWAGSCAAHLLPKFKLPVGVEPKHISRDPAVCEEYSSDPLCKPIGSLRGLSDMLNEGPKINSTYYRDFPSDLPLLLWHGTDDKVTSYDESQKFVDQCPAKDKEFKSWPNCYHECQNEVADVKDQVRDYLAAWILRHSVRGDNSKTALEAHL